jgi:hypothetical protein
VRPIHRENFLSPFIRTHSQNGQQDKAIGDQNNQDSDYFNRTHKVEEEKLIHLSIRTRNSKKWRNITEHMLDFIGSTEGQGKCGHCV